jgi:hypothetical protein
VRSGVGAIPALLARISTDDQFQFGIRTSWPVSKPSNRTKAFCVTDARRRPPLRAWVETPSMLRFPTLGDDVVGI